MVILVGIALLASQAAFAQSTQLNDGRVEGRVIFEGAIPKDPTPDENGLRDNLISVDPRSRGLLHTVVYLKGVTAQPKNPLPPAKMDQVNHRFAPRVLAVRAGQSVLFTNSDPANHNVRTSSSVATNEFNVFTGTEGSYRRTFAADLQNRPVMVGCDIHPWMRGWVYVFEHPFFSVTDEQGRFTIAEMPPGEYQIEIVHPDIGFREHRKVMVKTGEICSVPTVTARSKQPLR